MACAGFQIAPGSFPTGAAQRQTCWTAHRDCHFLKCLISFLKSGFLYFPCSNSRVDVFQPCAQRRCQHRSQHGLLGQCQQGLLCVNQQEQRKSLGQPHAGNPGHPEDLTLDSDLNAALLMVRQEPQDRLPYKTAAKHSAKSGVRDPNLSRVLQFWCRPY